MKKIDNVKKNFFKYFIEFFIVAFGVFLGMYASERKSDNELNRNKDKTIENVIQELESNRTNLQNSIEYHQMMRVNFDSLLQTIPKESYPVPFLQNNTFNKFTQIKNWTGHGFAELESTAFEVAKTSGTLQNMDIEIIQEISTIYNKLEILSDFEKSIVERMTQLSYDTKTLDVIITIEIILGDNLNMEKRILEQLEESIEKIKTLHNNN